MGSESSELECNNYYHTCDFCYEDYEEHDDIDECYHRCVFCEQKHSTNITTACKSYRFKTELLKVAQEFKQILKNRNNLSNNYSYDEIDKLVSDLRKSMLESTKNI